MRICEIFRSIQGEGLMMGIPTTFVRTVGCNLRCSWCDTQYSMSGGTEMTLDEIMESVGDSKHVCVTGGEPMIQPDMPELLRRMVAAGIQIVLETNGAADLSQVPEDPLILISMDVKCPSSGMSEWMLPGNLRFLSKKDQIKFVVKDDADFDYAVNFLRENPVDSNLIFGPVGGTGKLEWLVSRVLDSGLDARVLPQLHKIIWGDRRSV
ncbi:MAG: radical SAM protein [Candidatus Methanomethylophilaceae archaeon]|nr:radical SAM protein [Candidatus Methanomethylophilaceae archaeon]